MRVMCEVYMHMWYVCMYVVFNKITEEVVDIMDINRMQMFMQIYIFSNTTKKKKNKT